MMDQTQEVDISDPAHPSHIPSPFVRWGGRRFLLCVGCCGMCTALLVNGYLTAIIFRDIILGTVGGFITGNVIQEFRPRPGREAVPK